MRTGHVGVEYVEYVLRHKRNLSPEFTPLKLGNPALDQIPCASRPKVFPDALNAQVVAERLTERAEHFVFNDKGYRTKR